MKNLGKTSCIQRNLDSKRSARHKKINNIHIKKNNNY